VEFAMVVPLFLLLFFAVIDLGRWYFIRETLENAVRQAARYAITGSHLSTTNRYASIQQIALNAAIGIPIDNIKITSAEGGANSAGGPGDTVTIAITATVRFYTPGIARYFGTTGSNTFTVSATFRNENFPASQTS
jgi:Flp pilus assembly protein TadG